MDAHRWVYFPINYASYQSSVVNHPALKGGGLPADASHIVWMNTDDMLKMASPIPTHMSDKEWNDLWGSLQRLFPTQINHFNLFSLFIYHNLKFSISKNFICIFIRIVIVIFFFQGIYPFIINIC